jgi:uncharacterized protein (TIGR00251 family)
VTGSHEAGATLRVRVSPGSKKDGILGQRGDCLKIAVRTPAEGGRANREVCRILADYIGFAPRDVEVIRGIRSRDKVLLIRGVSAPKLLKALTIQ